VIPFHSLKHNSNKEEKEQKKEVEWREKRALHLPSSLHSLLLLSFFTTPLCSFLPFHQLQWNEMKRELVERRKKQRTWWRVWCVLGEEKRTARIHFISLPVSFLFSHHTTHHRTIQASQGFLGPFPFSSFAFCVVMKARTKREKRKEEKNPRTEWKKQKEQRKMNGARFTCPFISLCSFPSFHSLYPPHGLGLSLPSHSTKYKWQGIAWFSWMKKEAKEPKTIEWHLSWSCVLCVWFQLNKACVSLTFVTIELNTKDTTRTHFSFHFPLNYNGNQVKRELSGKERKEKWVLFLFLSSLLLFGSRFIPFHCSRTKDKEKERNTTQYIIIRRLKLCLCVLSFHLGYL